MKIKVEIKEGKYCFSESEIRELLHTTFNYGNRARAASTLSGNLAIRIDNDKYESLRARYVNNFIDEILQQKV